MKAVKVLEKKSLQETDVVEFFSKDKNIWCVHNGKKYSLNQLFVNAKKGDFSADKIISAIKLLMIDKAKKGEIILNQTSIPEFLNKYFNQRNNRLDIVIRNGIVNHRGEIVPAAINVDPAEMPGYNR
jgi:hypothetical protein